MYSRLSLFWITSSWAIGLLLVFPVIAIIYQGLQPAGDLFQHLMDTVMWDYIHNTVLLILGVGVLSFMMAIPAAWFMAMCDIPGRKYLQWALMLPLAMPAYIVAGIYTELLDFAGPVQSVLRDVFGWQTARDYWFPNIRSLGGAIVIIASVLFPYLYLLARTSFLEQSVTLMQSAQLLGKTPLQAFCRISLPLARPAIAVGLSLIAMETLADFATVNFFAVNTLTRAVFDTWQGYGSLHAAAKISTLMLVVVVMLLALERFSRRKQKVFQKNMGQESAHLLLMKPWQQWLAALFCWSLVTLGFIFPFSMLVYFATQYFTDSWTAEFIEFSLNTFFIAGVVAVLACIIAILVGLFRRLHMQRGSDIPARLSSMGYAVPGTVLAIGILIPFGWLDHSLNDLVEHFGGQGPGLLFSGTMLALIAGYLVRFTAIAVGAVESSINKIPPSLDMVSRTLGHSPVKMVRKVHIPLISKGCFTAVLLVFIESMKELPAALILRPFNFETLATYVYQFVSDEMIEHGALAAIVIILVGLVPLIILSRSIERH
ncbi:iron ABC transporter permease [Motilimonas sp. 1_MG-2023]|uniref:ABC transporter permease n=1 Tax=Motilimonas sp. 1_MG-2023 TaxID=3062672 RepID=UPI0026E357AE|nr:iron ABC transporter permease [Motilimonas sp. 1_MG-2023]MDO6524407.1 iron ABC transporter permease [Motilimonas sp. 1_MG-2023]